MENWFLLLEKRGEKATLVVKMIRMWVVVLDNLQLISVVLDPIKPRSLKITKISTTTWHVDISIEEALEQMNCFLPK